jgi:hypothetical protein
MGRRTLLTFALSAALIAALRPQASQAVGETTPAEAWGLPQLMLRLGAVKTSTARFTEIKYLHILNAPIVDSGVLVYVAPGHLEKDTLIPLVERLTIEGDTLTIERENKTETLTLSDYPQIGGLIEGIRATLAGNLVDLNRVFVSRLDGSMDAWRLVLQPRDVKVQAPIGSIRITGSDAHIKRIETLERDGDQIDMTITDDHP